jgi:hypothetical protein
MKENLLQLCKFEYICILELIIFEVLDMKPLDDYLWIMIAMGLSFLLSLFVFLGQRESHLDASCSSLRSLFFFLIRYDICYV